MFYVDVSLFSSSFSTIVLTSFGTIFCFLFRSVCVGQLTVFVWRLLTVAEFRRFLHQSCRIGVIPFQHRAERRRFGQDGITGIGRQFVVQGGHAFMKDRAADRSLCPLLPKGCGLPVISS